MANHLFHPGILPRLSIKTLVNLVNVNLIHVNNGYVDDKPTHSNTTMRIKI